MSKPSEKAMRLAQGLSDCIIEWGHAFDAEKAALRIDAHTAEALSEHKRVLVECERALARCGKAVVNCAMVGNTATDKVNMGIATLIDDTLRAIAEALSEHKRVMGLAEDALQYAEQFVPECADALRAIAELKTNEKLG